MAETGKLELSGLLTPPITPALWNFDSSIMSNEPNLLTNVVNSENKVCTAGNKFNFDTAIWQNNFCDLFDANQIWKADPIDDPVHFFKPDFNEMWCKSVPDNAEHHSRTSFKNESVHGFNINGASSFIALPGFNDKVFNVEKPVRSSLPNSINFSPLTESKNTLFHRRNCQRETLDKVRSPGHEMFVQMLDQNFEEKCYLRDPNSLQHPIVMSPNFKYNCSRHAQLQCLLYCDTCKQAVCMVCGLHSIGAHFEHELCPKHHVKENGKICLDTLNVINNVIDKVLAVLREQDIFNPYMESKEFEIVVFNSSHPRFNCLPRGHEMSEILMNLNELLLKLLQNDSYEIILAAIAQIENKFNELIEENRNDIDSKVVLSKNGPESPLPSNCDIVGQGTEVSVVGVETCFYVVAKNEANAPCKFGTFPFDVTASFISSGKQVAVHIQSHYMPGVSRVIYNYTSTGLYKFDVRVNSESVKAGPFNVYVSKCSKFHPCIEQKREVGDEKNFNNPWGVCVDNDGMVYISDRCNNNIKVLNQKGEFQYTFGESGVEIGQLRKPSGIAIDKENNILVCDKDNHRLQIFGKSGDVLRCTGKLSYFTYPWSVAVNSKNSYVVTHSKTNVCIFASNLNCLANINFDKVEVPRCTKLSPRGVCIGYLDEIIVTDFESGNVYYVDFENGKAHFAFDTNSNGKWDQRRLQGISMDSEGFLYIADSKNGVVEVYSYNGSFVSSWEVPNKPLHVAVLKSNYIITCEGKNGKSASVFIYGKGEKSESVETDKSLKTCKRFPKAYRSFGQTVPKIQTKPRFNYTSRYLN